MTSLKPTVRTVGKWISCWDGIFSGALAISFREGRSLSQPEFPSLFLFHPMFCQLVFTRHGALVWNMSIFKRIDEQKTTISSIQKISFTFFFSMGRILLRWKGHTMKFFPWKLTNVFLKMDFVGSDYSFPFEMVPWKSLATIFDRLVFEFHHYFSRGENQHPEGSLTFLKWWVDFQRKKLVHFSKGVTRILLNCKGHSIFFCPRSFNNLGFWKMRLFL